MLVAGFTKRELRRTLVLEVTRADACFIQSQIAAQEAMRSDLLLGMESMVVAQLEIQEVHLAFSLTQSNSSWIHRGWQAIRRCIGCRVPSSNAEPRYQFSRPDKGCVTARIVLRRDSTGLYQAIEEADDA